MLLSNTGRVARCFSCWGLRRGLAVLFACCPSRARAAAPPAPPPPLAQASIKAPLVDLPFESSGPFGEGFYACGDLGVPKLLTAFECMRQPHWAAHCASHPPPLGRRFSSCPPGGLPFPPLDPHSVLTLPVWCG
ncbi:MAG: hypothetical protein J3K34DRAFT_92889 [Monoraphidium minutum]|nr:MAG: hypothetical protein J3K34DRAFT_92889 [Monoraphidium minutum]